MLVPAAVDDEALQNLLVECVGKVAAWEGRYAGDVLNDLLPAARSPVNGAPRADPAAHH